MGEMRDRMRRGELYIADGEDLAADFGRAQALLERFNGLGQAAFAEHDGLLRELLGHVGERVHVRPPFRCE